MPLNHTSILRLAASQQLIIKIQATTAHTGCPLRSIATAILVAIASSMRVAIRKPRNQGSATYIRRHAAVVAVDAAPGEIPRRAFPALGFVDVAGCLLDEGEC